MGSKIEPRSIKNGIDKNNGKKGERPDGRKVATSGSNNDGQHGSRILGGK